MSSAVATVETAPPYRVSQYAIASDNRYLTHHRHPQAPTSGKDIPMPKIFAVAADRIGFFENEIATVNEVITANTAELAGLAIAFSQPNAVALKAEFDCLIAQLGDLKRSWSEAGEELVSGSESDQAYRLAAASALRNKGFEVCAAARALYASLQN
ncbi:hypothetical protein [Rhizobium sp. Rhizsp82]|uniref:hypothetical protein n=1 Tax=Rhizobium sp. Rhizsp82 TaxID=3243057 RepID=UPI0039B4F870